MNLANLLSAGRKFPPGYIKPSQWPRLSGYHQSDQTFDPPKYQKPGKLINRLVEYYEEAIYFDMKTEFRMPRAQEDGVVKARSFFKHL